MRRLKSSHSCPGEFVHLRDTQQWPRTSQSQLLEAIPQPCLHTPQAINQLSRRAHFTLLSLSTIALSFLITPNDTLDTERHVCIFMYVNTTPSSTSTALLQEASLTQLYTSHSAQFPCCNSTLLLHESLQCQHRQKSTFLLLLWMFTAPPAAEEIMTKFLPISIHHTWESSKHNQGCFVRLWRHSCTVRSQAEDCASWLDWSGIYFSSNPSNVIDTTLLTNQWQVQFLEE